MFIVDRGGNIVFVRADPDYKVLTRNKRDARLGLLAVKRKRCSSLGSCER
jgi:hypothetical protein